MLKTLRTLAVGAALALGVTAAQAAPLTTNPGSLVANGNVRAVFVFSDAWDSNDLYEVSFGGGSTVIFNNLSTAQGTTTALGVYAGAIQFILNNVTKGNTFANDVASSEGYFHATYSTNYSSFGVGSMPAASAAAIAALGTPVLFIGWEDKTQAQGSDFDYNDLIFAFTDINTPVPEPASLALFGAGLLGLGLARRRRRA